MSNICIIPARGGSKRIQKKNIKPFLGKPIIAYSIEAAINSNLFDEVMVSTDDKEIEEVALRFGAKVPFLRSKKNSDDFSGTVDVIIEVLKNYNIADNENHNICCLYPTAPMVTIDSIKSALELLVDKKYDTVFPVTKFSYPIQRALKIAENQKVSMIWPENMSKRSQDLPSSYHDAGQFYWMTSNSIIKSKKIYSENSGVIILNKMIVQDIDTIDDWNIAELKMKNTFKLKE